MIHINWFYPANQSRHRKKTQHVRERSLIAWYRSLPAIQKLLVSYLMAYPQMLEEFLSENHEQKDDLYALLNTLKSFLP